MELIIDFYKGLDTLNLIIFWGIIIVIILLLVFSSILINKNKKLKKMINKKEEEENDEIPIIREDSSNTIEKSITLPSIPEIPKEKQIGNEMPSKTIETEKKFIAEEHVMEYNNDMFSLSNIKKTTENPKEEANPQPIKKNPIEMPTGPYQRNVLREMSLSQTSPIGINREIRKETKKEELAKDLESSLNNEQTEIFLKQEEPKLNMQTKQEVNSSIKEEIGKISLENASERKTEIKIDPTHKSLINERDNKKGERVISNHSSNINSYGAEDSEPQQIFTDYSKRTEYISKNNDINVSKYQNTENINEEKTTSYKKTVSDYSSLAAKELLTIETQTQEDNLIKTSSERYLEEVSKKLAEAEVPDGIERTNYELKQEEDAIISYKELMAKKDSLQTIDEEDAVISIEELMNRNQQSQQENIETREDTKLYKLSDEEENEDFLKELKQFRNDL